MTGNRACWILVLSVFIYLAVMLVSSVEMTVTISELYILNWMWFMIIQTLAVVWSNYRIASFHRWLSFSIKILLGLLYYYFSHGYRLTLAVSQYIGLLKLPQCVFRIQYYASQEIFDSLVIVSDTFTCPCLLTSCHLLTLVHIHKEFNHYENYIIYMLGPCTLQKAPMLLK